jgi:hypothetical protein
MIIYQFPQNSPHHLLLNTFFIATLFFIAGFYFHKNKKRFDKNEIFKQKSGKKNVLKTPKLQFFPKKLPK